MADEKVGIKITVDGKEAEQSVGSIRKQLKEANAELIRAQEEFGQFSAEAVSAAKKVANLKDQIGDAAEITALFDPGKKFAAFSAAIQGVAGGFAAVQGAIGLLGVESEDLEKQLLKVQSALALSEGLSTISDLGPKLEGLKSTLSNISIVQKANAAANRLAAATMTTFGVSVNTTSVAFRVLRGAIIATGIGVLVVALGAAVEAFSNFKSAAEEAADAQKDLNKQVVEGAKAQLKGEIESNERTTKLLVAQAKARGASVEEINKIEQGGLEIRRNAYKRYYDEVKNADAEAAEDAQTNLKNANNEIAVAEANAQAERLAKQKEAEQKKREAAGQQSQQAKEQQKQLEQEAQNELAQLKNENEKAQTETSVENENERAKRLIDVELKQATERVKATKYSQELKDKIIAELEKKAQLQRDEVNKKIGEDEKKRVEELAKRVGEIRTEIEENNITDETERRLFAVRNKYAQEIAEAEKGEGDVAALVTALRDRQRQEEDAIEQERREKQAEQNIADLEKIVNDDAVEIERKKEVLAELEMLNEQYYNAGIITYEQFVKTKGDIAKAEMSIEDMKLQKFYATANAYAQLLGDVSNLLGKSTAAGKAAAIAEATINTVVATVKAFKANADIPPSPIFGIAAASVAAATGFKQIQAIKNVQVPNSGGASAAPSGIGGLPTISASAPIAPPRPQAQVFELGQQSMRGINTASQRAYVVESDITSAQERVTRLNRAARLG